ncbi:xylulokinase [Fontivita pretiosa]|uniref:xylulokinase n=1 Tax=Fontivita pretiosa TaxID=2989684 RepID=UPI003D17A77E
MLILALDIGSSSVKAGLLRDGRIVGRPARETFPTRYIRDRAEVDPEAIVRAIVRSIRALGPQTRRIDCIALATMSPSWLAMDRRGRAITPVVTHQDRRSLDVAIEIERRIGKARHLKMVGARPVPGGISSTTCGWFVRHEPQVMRRADLVGHLSTYLHRQLTGARVVDPSHASFMGLYSTLKLGGWNDELCEVVGITRKLLPEVRDADQIGGQLTPDAARRLGLAAGTPMLVGFIDTSAVALLAGARPGQLVNVVGSTDVLALCTDKPRPHERLLTRALGVGGLWLSVGTIAAAGSSLEWARQQLFPDLDDQRFYRMVQQLAATAERARDGVEFEPYLAGDRCSLEQRQGAFRGLTLASTRRQLLAAIIDALARASAVRLDLLRAAGTRLRREILVSGGGSRALSRVMYRDWPGRWRFRRRAQATLLGLGCLACGCPEKTPDPLK